MGPPMTDDASSHAAHRTGDGRYSRRALLQVGLGLGTLGLAGCVSRAQPEGSQPRGTAELPTRFWLTPVVVPESKRGALDPIVYRDLSAAERAIIRTTLEEGEYEVRSDEIPPALKQLRERIEARTDGGETLAVYLRHGETYYRVGYAAGDHVIAAPDA